jgi:cytidylate kinase
MTVIAIDGPAGSGKSTLARLLSERLGFAHLDTGAMYRALAYLALRDGVALDDGATLARLAREARIAFTARGLIVAAERDVSDEIRRPPVSAAVSEVSAHAKVRDVLLDEQRRIGADADVVVEGRDIGTVVFPEAPVKLFLTASPEVRAERRRKELIGNGEHVGADETLQAIVARDAYDSGRAVAPLRRAPDAIELDTSGLTIDQVVEAALAIVRARLGAHA